MLVSSGIKNVVMADSGQRVLRLIQSMRVDVLIYDCNILDPYWLHLRESLDELESPVNKPGLVVTSGSPLKREFEDVNSAGLTTFLPGEVERRVLFQVILKAYR